MKISEIQVEQFGVWKNLQLPVNPQGLTVLYGPNEAGKSTLMRFVRSVLYGYPQRDAAHHEATHDDPLDSLQAGGLQLLTGDGPCRLQRRSQGASRGEISFAGASKGGTESPTATLDALLKGINESVYENIFAVGLRELQELATLKDQKVAQRIYGLTMGVEGRRLLEACNGVRQERRRLYDPAQRTGAMFDLMAEQDRLDAELRNFDHLPERHAELATQRDRIAQELTSCQERQAGLQEQLRGHNFLDRVHGPWKKLQQCRDELDELPAAAGFPEDGLSKLHQYEAELGTMKDRRERLKQELQQLVKKSQLLVPPELGKHAEAMQGYVLQKGWVQDLDARIRAATDQVQQIEKEVKTRCEQLGKNWTLEALDAIDVSPAAHHRLAGVARIYQTALLRRSSVRHVLRRQAQAHKNRQQAVAEQVAALGGKSVDEALGQARQQYENLKTLATLKLQEQEFADRQAGIDEQLAHIRPQHILPTWVYVVLGVFCIAGISLGAWGLMTGIHSSGVAGFTYALLGLTTAGVAWGVKTQFEGDARERLDQLEDSSKKNLEDLQSVRNQLTMIGGYRGEDSGRLGSTRTRQRREESASAAPGENSVSESHDLVGEMSEEELPLLVRTLEKAGQHAKQLSHKAWNFTKHQVFGFTPPAESAPNETVNGHVSNREATAPPNDTGDKGVEAPAKNASGKSRAGLAGPVLKPQSAARRTAPPLEEPAVERRPVPPTGPLSELELIDQTAIRMTDLEALRRQQQSIQNARVKLADRSRKLKNSRREVETARQAWQDLLAHNGFAPTLKVDEAFEAWRLLVETADHRERWRQAVAELNNLRGLWTSFQHRIEELGRRAEGAQADFSKPLAVLQRWEQKLGDLSKRKQERVQMAKEVQAKRRDGRKLSESRQETQRMYNALLVKGGAANRREFEERAKFGERRRVLKQQAQDYQNTLMEITQAHSDLAIVEQDLERFNPKENAQAIETLKQELKALDRDLGQARERLGAVRQELQQLEDDREATRLRYERAQVTARLEAAGKEWLALETASTTINEMRSRYERTCQPKTLAVAARFLNRLTGGKYHNVWTPLDSHELRIEDAQQSSFSIEQLSTGTREQLFLAVRLALVQELRQQGVELPMVFDDVLVNFDQQRAEAAAGVLLEYARDQQVLFFTCHQHLASVFGGLGVPVVELPVREGDRRRAG